MGGNAIKTGFGIETKRVGIEEFLEIFYETQSLLYARGWAEICDYVKFYTNKSDHGDIDIVVGFDDWETITEDQICEAFETKYVIKNSNVFSVLFRGVQIDLIFVPVETYWPNLRFRNFSPFGNIFSRLLKQLDVSWKVDGLYYVFREGGFKKNILLTRHFNTILRFGGLRPEDYGVFPTQESIFDLVLSSPYFQKEIYYFENLNHVNKKRDAVRPDYHAWNNYIKDKEDNWSSAFNNEQANLERISKWFPHISFKIQDCYKEVIRSLRIKQKFNGDIISLKTGLVGEELGRVMKEYRELIGENFESYIEIAPKKEVIGNFMKWWDFKNNLN